MGNRVLRKKFRARCNKCSHVFDLNEDIFVEREKRDDQIPFSARSSSSTLICPKCNNIDFTIYFEYHYVYRHRCVKCDEMFDAKNTYELRCPECQENFIEVISKFGA